MFNILYSGQMQGIALVFGSLPILEETQVEFMASCFLLTQPLLSQAFGEQAIYWDLPLIKVLAKMPFPSIVIHLIAAH